MDKLMVAVSVIMLAFLGSFALACACALLWRKAARLSIWKMPRRWLVGFAAACAFATVAAQKTSARLVYRSTLDSESAVTTPVVGSAGTCNGATFVEGKKGSALHVPAYAGVAEIPLPDGLPPERGCIEFWAKLEGNKEWFADAGDPMFLQLSLGAANSYFGWIEFNNNNGGGKSGFGGMMNGLSAYSCSTMASYLYSDILSDKVSEWHHYAMVWNVDGIDSLSGKPRFAFLVDGRNVAASSNDDGFDKTAFISGMTQSLKIFLSSPGTGYGKSPYAIDELRIWDSDVTTFNDDDPNVGVRYVDASAPEGGTGLSWDSAARTIDAVSRNLYGGVIYVKPGTYGTFSYHEPSLAGDPILIVATGAPEETVIDGAGESKIESLEADLPHELAPSKNPYLRIEGFTVRGMNARACNMAFDRCVISNFTKGVAYSSSFRNCQIVGNELNDSNTTAGLFESCWFDNCTVAANTSSTFVGRDGVARNSIFWGNSGTPYLFLYAMNCCLEGVAHEGTGNFSENPLFVDAEKGNWRLAEGSPCIDAGDDASAAGDKDFAGSVRIQGSHVDVGAYEFVPPTPPVRLVYRSTLDSAAAIENPLVGANGTCCGATFVEGKIGSALHVPAHSNVATIPLPNGLPQEKGCIEFWAKLQEGKTSYIDGGDPTFIRVSEADSGARFFTFEFNANNGSGRGGLLAMLPGINIAPEVWAYSKSYSTYIDGDVSGWHRYAFVWNVDGIDAISGSPSAALLVDGQIKATASIDPAVGREGFLAQMDRPLELAFNCPDSGHGKSSYAIDELRIWDSDVTTFVDLPSYFADASYVYDGTPHTLQSATGAVGNEEFRYALSEEGPFASEKPTLTDAGTMRVWYTVSVDGITTLGSAAVTVEKRPVTFTSASAEKSYDGTPLTDGTVSVTGGVPEGEGFAFSVSGTQTAIGESDNTFTWTPNDGTNPENYEVSVAYGKLTVTIASGNAGYEIVHGASGDSVRVTRLDYPDGGDVTLPTSFGGLPVAVIASGALSGSAVTGVTVPSGVTVEGALFNGLQNVTNVSFAAGSVVTGPLNFGGCAALREVVLPAQAVLMPHTFLGCWALERVVFAGEPPFGNEAPADADASALLVASVRPATLFQMADMICYPEEQSAKWEKSLRNFGYGGRYGAYAGEWTGVDALVAGSGNLNGGTSGTTDPDDPSGQPAALYAAQTGRESGTVIAGAAGWDVLGVPDGMTWDRETGTLGGTPKRSGTYDVILVSGSGASTKMMRTTLEVAGYAVTTGYVGTAFKVSGAPWNALASYKTVPPGLAWKSKVLSGVPTKAGTWTYKTKDGEPVKVAVLALPAGTRETFNGVVSDAAGKRYPLKVSVTAAGKLSATVVKGTKSYSLAAAKWSKVALESVDGEPHRMFTATLTAKGLSLTVKVDADAAWNTDALIAAGTLGAVKGLAGTAQHNVFASDAGANAAASARAGTYSLSAQSDGAGGWALVPPAEGVKGALAVVLKSNGAATLSGTLPNKTKVNASSTLYVGADGSATLRFYVKGVWIVWALGD